ncbi:MAG: prepilin-type N-terminal cleavage/methylation domain-containing protein [Candidatus Adlerbacteria bacterium]|nr:prepilin-type N-terminal cleavage/methylation domain-containing protein [Candidatus Adlerbacteria bacterium]
MSTFLQRFRSYSSKGFTLTELMVVVTIMTLLTGIFLFQQRQFDSTTILRSLAYSVALSIRQAQTYGISVRGFEGVFAEAHGIHFSSGDLTHYYLFADIDNDRVFDSGTEIAETFGLVGNNFTISQFCATTNSGTERCYPGELTSLSILFIRPNPDACFETSNSPTACVAGDAGEDYKEVEIQLAGPSGTTRSVTVTTTGQISVGAVGN